MDQHDPILIALLPKPADLHRAREGWYRVPLRHAPAALMRAKALALYQPSSFLEARWQVGHWAPVRGLQEMRRRQLIPEEAEHRRADEMYLCVRLGPLVPVEPPKKSEKGRRLLFVPTTWGEFAAAATLDELLESPVHPIQDSLMYELIQQQIAGTGGIALPETPRQKRLFELSDADYDAIDW
jgi:hypothetical protein